MIRLLRSMELSNEKRSTWLIASGIVIASLLLKLVIEFTFNASDLFEGLLCVQYYLLQPVTILVIWFLCRRHKSARSILIMAWLVPMLAVAAIAMILGMDGIGGGLDGVVNFLIMWTSPIIFTGPFFIYGVKRLNIAWAIVATVIFPFAGIAFAAVTWEVLLLI